MPSQPAYCRTVAHRAFAAEMGTVETAAGLFRAAWAIALHEMPDAELAEGEAAIGNLVQAIRGRVQSHSPEAVLAHLHDVMFDVLDFQGNAEDYYNPGNSYLPEVLRSRRGLPITLVLVYRRVAADLGLTVHGINAPGHFLAEVALDPAGTGPPMYVDPFFGGGLLTPAEVFARIAETTGRAVEPSPHLLARATGAQWLRRMLHNLQGIFAAAGRDRDLYAMQELEELLRQN